ncbi:MAG: S41 family peptidase [Ignavibacteriales bacterium]|nr:S41 family peptidase [Ignavibacteriales bacterium]
MFKSKTNILIAFIILLAGILIGLQINKLFVDKSVTEGSAKFDEVLNYTQKYYYQDVDTKELVDDAITGMLSALDPHSVYIPPAEQIGIEEEFRGNFEGIGIEFQIINDTINVVSPISGGPSENVGIEAGDRIVKINSKSSIGFTNPDVVKNLRGEKGTKVDVTIYRPSVKKILDFEIYRDQIPIYTVDASLLMSDSIGYVSLSKFAETSIDEVKQALEKLTKLGMKKLILDLRNNPGGYLNQAFQVADLFIDDGKLIVYTRGRIASLDDNLRAEKTYSYENIPLVVLINKGSASASEIVSGAIQDWDRGIIVGETSFGKGLVQRPFLLEDSSAVRITISKYYTPSGRAIQRDYEDKEEYYNEVLDRVEVEGDNTEHKAEVDSTKTEIFHTNGGRRVVSGGGITPDFIVKNSALTDYSIKLRGGNVFYKFVRRYIDSNPQLLTNYQNNFELFKNNFSFTDSDMKSFIKFAERNDVVYSNDDFQKDEQYIKTRLKAQIARNYWNNNGWYAVLLELDEQYLKAKELLESNYKLPTKY